MNLLLPASLLLLSLTCAPFVGATDNTPFSPISSESVSRPLAVVAFSNPRGLAVDRSGNLYIADVDAGTMYTISPAGEVHPLVGPGIKTPIGIAIAPDGKVFVADAEGSAIYWIASSGGVTALPNSDGEAGFNSPTNVAVDAAGNVFVANNLANTILKISPKGGASVFAGKTGASGSTDGMGGDARFNTPLAVALDAKGNLYVADKDNSNIRKITPAGVVSTLAGMAGQSGSVDGTGIAASFAAPRALAVDAKGTVYVADTENSCIRKITSDGIVTTLAGKAGQAGKVDGMGSDARFNDPRGIAVDTAGNVYVADGGNAAIRRVTPEGVVTTVAAAGPGLFAASAAPGAAPILPPRAGQTERIDYSHAQNFDGWDADPTYWTVKDGMFTARGEKVPSTFLLTKKNYSDFRLTLSSKMVESENHAGIVLWGEQTVTRNGRNKWSYKGPLLMFPGLGLWDYRTNKNIPVDPVGKALARKIAGQHDWIKVEILAQGNRIRVAYNGQQVLDWREPDPSLLKDGPIGLQLHGHTPPQEVVYKNVVIEAFPKEDRLITVKE